MKLQWIRPDWPVCLLGHEAFKRPTCRALSCLSLIWVKLLLLHRCCYRPWLKSSGSTLFSRVCAADAPAPGYLPSSLRPHCSDIAGGNIHEAAGGDVGRRSCVLVHKLITREMLQTPSAGGEVAPRARACVHVCGHAGRWKTKCCWGDNAQRRKESARRELHY